MFVMLDQPCGGRGHAGRACRHAVHGYLCQDCTPRVHASPTLHSQILCLPSLGRQPCWPCETPTAAWALPLMLQGPVGYLVKPQLACLTCLTSPGAAPAAARQGLGARGESTQSSKQPAAASASRGAQTGAGRQLKTMQVAMMGAQVPCTKMQRRRIVRWAGLDFAAYRLHLVDCKASL